MDRWNSLEHHTRSVLALVSFMSGRAANRYFCWTYVCVLNIMPIPLNSTPTQGNAKICVCLIRYILWCHEVCTWLCCVCFVALILSVSGDSYSSGLLHLHWGNIKNTAKVTPKVVACIDTSIIVHASNTILWNSWSHMVFLQVIYCLFIQYRWIYVTLPIIAIFKSHHVRLCDIWCSYRAGI